MSAAECGERGPETHARGMENDYAKADERGDRHGA